MKKRDYDFDTKDLISSLNETLEYAQGKVTLRSMRRDTPHKAVPITAKQVVNIRQRLNVSQTVFAKALNVSPMTAKSWESGRRTPCGAALRLLEIAFCHPDVLTGTLAHSSILAEDSDEVYLPRNKYTKNANTDYPAPSLRAQRSNPVQQR